MKRRTPSLLGIGFGVLYGVTLRLLFCEVLPATLFSALSLGFLIVGPLAVGYLSVRVFPEPTWAETLGPPCASCVLMAAFAAAIGWEGMICIVMALPVMLVAATLGGIAARLLPRSRTAAAVVVVLPFVVAPIEAMLDTGAEIHETATRIEIRSPESTVWTNIVQVPPIGEGEFRPRFIHKIGFPRPLAALSEGEGVGSIRTATFVGGVTFVETVHDWNRNRDLAFSIRALTDRIPAVTLDEHVTIGGPYFDVLDGRYRIEPLGDDRVLLHLTSRYRLSTGVDFYAAPWCDYVMRNIQETILEVIRDRCERVG